MSIYDRLAALVIFFDVGAVIGMFLYFYLTDWKKPATVSPWIIKTLGILSIGALLLLFVSPAKAESLCSKLNNPMCVTGSKANPWQGQIAIKQHGLVQFQTMEHGIRAGVIMLRRYQEHNINTIAGLVRRLVAGDEELYINYLSKRLGVPREAYFDISERLPELVQSISLMESGVRISTEKIRRIADDNEDY